MPPSVRLVVTEGNYLLLDDARWGAARALLDETWLVETDDTARRDRLIRRNVEFGKSPEDATAWVTRSDEANAAQIRARSVAPDLVVSLG